MKEMGERGERDRNREIGKYLDRKTETKRALSSGGISVFPPIFKFEMNICNLKLKY